MLYTNNSNYSGEDSGGYAIRVLTRLASLQWTMLLFKTRCQLRHTLRTLIFPNH